jgi:hypothetical protein
MTRRPTTGAALGLLSALAACAGAKADRCASYNAVMSECLSEAGVDVTETILEGNACATLEGEPYPDYFACVTDALEGADCSGVDGLRAASKATAHCKALLTFPYVEPKTIDYPDL